MKKYNVPFFLRALIPNTRSWYIKESQKILKKFNVPLLDDIYKFSDLVGKVKPGSSLTKFANMTWAINGNRTHGTETIIKVYERLKEATSKKQVVEILNNIADIFAAGGRL